MVRPMAVALSLTALSAMVCDAPVIGQPDLAAQGVPHSEIVPYTLHVPDAVLSDLKERLARARFPDEVEGSGWAYGPNVAYLKQLVAYWRDKYDWREQERRFNQFHQFQTNIEGMNIHFIHARSSVPNARPIILLHGWPGSPYELTRMIASLTDPVSHGGRPEDAFDVVIPSIPGYGFSDRPRERGWGSERVAQVLVTLMARLGYTRYAVHGGDIGVGVGSRIAIDDASRVIGLHINLCASGPPADAANPNDGVPAADLERMREKRASYANDLTHSQANRTKAQTIGYGLNDSPVGLAGWFLEKYQRYCDCDGDLQKKWTMDELINWIMMYWVPQTAASAARYYHENPPALNQQRVEVPTACAIFPKEVLYTPRRYNEMRYNLIRWTEMPHGGHYAAWEQPDLMVGDIRAFFRDLR
jgi:microsomal epoxide hydrolase